jgi:hypothetical protein
MGEEMSNDKKWACNAVKCSKWFDGKCPSFATPTTSKNRCKTNPKDNHKADNIKAI